MVPPHAQARQGVQRELRKAEKAVAAAERAVGGSPPTSAAAAEDRLRELQAVADSGAQACSVLAWTSAGIQRDPYASGSSARLYTTASSTL